jgi:hypothetical protein
MTTSEDTAQTLLENIALLARRAGDAKQTSGTCLAFAQAARELAEAHAWLASPAQAHGGSGTVVNGS